MRLSITLLFPPLALSCVLSCAPLCRAGTLLVLNKDEATLAFLDLTSKEVVATVPVGEQPHEIAVSDDGRLAFVSNYGSGPKPGNSISVVDIPGKKELHRVNVAPLGRPHGIYWAQGKCYFTSEANKVIGRYDPAINQIDWMLGTGQNTTHMVMVSRDGKQMYTANIGSNTITIVDVAKNFDETSVPVGKGPEGFDVSPDGAHLWAAHSQDGGVSIIDLASKKVTGTIDLQTKRSNRLKFTPDGKMVLVSDLAGNELLFVDVPTRKVVKKVPAGQGTEGILILPDGSRAYVASAGSNAILVFDLKSMSQVDQLSPGKGPDGMAYVP